MNTGTPTRAPGLAKPGKLPSPATSRAGGGASVVVGARESRARGEGRQWSRAVSMPEEKAMYVASEPDRAWLFSVQRKLYTRSRDNLDYVFR